MEMAQKEDWFVLGVDVSKAKLDLVWGPDGSLETIANREQAIAQNLIAKIKDPVKTLVVMEGTGGYESLLADLLHQANVPLAIVNPRRVRDFAKGIGWDAKTDPIDARLIARYGEVVKPQPQVAKTTSEKKLEALVTRRRQLLGLINQENNRLQQTRDQRSWRHGTTHASRSFMFAC